MRFNIFGGFLVLAITSLSGEAAELLAQPDNFYRANGYAVLVGLVMLLAWPFLAWRRRLPSNGAEQGPPSAYSS
jgi:hypothetical protein